MTDNQTFAKMKVITDSMKEIIRKYDKGDNLSTNIIRKIIQKFSAKHKLSSQPKNLDMISIIPQNYRKKLLPILKAKPVRTASGIAVVAVMSKPHRLLYWPLIVALFSGC